MGNVFAIPSIFQKRRWKPREAGDVPGSQGTCLTCVALSLGTDVPGGLCQPEFSSSGSGRCSVLKEMSD
jgi:hypothetical protein